MASPKEYPNFIAGVAALGAKRILAITTEKKIDLAPGTDATALATALLAKLKLATNLGLLDDEDEEPIGIALGLGRAKDWKPKLSKEEIAALPSYRQPSYAQDVYDALYLRVRPGRAEIRGPAPAESKSHAKDWPELAAAAKWKKAKASDVAKALAKALGLEAAPPSHDGHARVVDPKLGLAYVAIVGGKLTMGLSADEKRALNKRAKALGPEAQEHAKWLAKQAAPTRDVTVAPFLCAETLLSGAHAKRLGRAPSKDDPLRVDAEDAAALVKKSARRLLSEAEWEYVARTRGHAWLNGDEDAREWMADDEVDPPYGVRGLAWGEWVDDGWHDTYKGAPTDGRAWEPRGRPEVVRSGARALWPWQVGGEELLLHVAARDRSTGESGVRLAIDLPARKR